jgi:hypothetical protein
LVERWGEGVDEVARSDGGRDVFKHQNGGRERVDLAGIAMRIFSSMVTRNIKFNSSDIYSIIHKLVYFNF